LPFTPEEVKEKWATVVDFGRVNDYPNGPVDTYSRISANLERIEENKAKLAKPVAQPAGGLKADQIFTLMRVYLDRGEGKALVPKVQSIYAFEITKAKGGPVLKSWTIDLKQG
jgi:3-hydroxyacyl-CoA dehydrogenase/3a,7a,12a-trihydroxy-5b-cholest-24-enoyl-CoA hydratase